MSYLGVRSKSTNREVLWLHSPIKTNAEGSYIRGFTTCSELTYHSKLLNLLFLFGMPPGVIGKEAVSKGTSVSQNGNLLFELTALTLRVCRLCIEEEYIYIFYRM